MKCDITKYTSESTDTTYELFAEKYKAPLDSFKNYSLAHIEDLFSRLDTLKIMPEIRKPRIQVLSPK